MSGLPEAPEIPGREIDSELVLSFSHFELYRSLATVKPVYEPGERFQYSMLGYGVLGHVLELRTGLSFEVLLRERLLEPLEMHTTTVTLRPEHLALLATPYHIDRNLEVAPAMAADMEALAPAGGVASSVEDLAAFLSLHLGNAPAGEAPVRGETLTELYRQRWPFSNGLGYALRWGRDRLPVVGDVVFHDGRILGYTSYVGFSRKHQVGVIVLTNLGGDATPRPVRELGHGILRLAVEEGGQPGFFSGFQ